MVEQFEFTHSQIDGVFVGAPVGEVDLAAAPKLEAGLVAHLDGDPPPAMVIRLDLVTFLDSAGISVLVRVHRLARRLGVPFALAAPSKPVQKVFAITQLERAVPTHATLCEALTQARAHVRIRN